MRCLNCSRKANRGNQEIQHLLAEEFDVEYPSDYLGKFLRNLGLSYAKPRPIRPNRPENREEVLGEGFRGNITSSTIPDRV
jgi:transposase